MGLEHYPGVGHFFGFSIYFFYRLGASLLFMCDYFITVVEGVGFWESVFLTQALHQTGEISVVFFFSVAQLLRMQSNLTPIFGYN